MFSGHKQSNYTLAQTITVLQIVRTKDLGHLKEHLQFTGTTYGDMLLPATPATETCCF